MYIVTYHFNDYDEDYYGYDICETEEQLNKVVSDYEGDNFIEYEVYSDVENVTNVANQFYEEIYKQEQQIKECNNKIKYLENKVQELESYINRDMVEENKQLRLKLHDALNTLTGLKTEFKYNIHTIDEQIGKIKNE